MFSAFLSARRRLSLNKTADSITQVELDQVRSLEEEKYRLQRELQDTKGALDAYTTKLRGQVSINNQKESSSVDKNTLQKKNIEGI